MADPFRGAARRLDDIDLPKLGYQLGVGEDELHAFIDVETRGGGFDAQNRPRILFERHKFYKYLPAEKRAEAVNAGLASKSPGGYGKESEQYSKLARLPPDNSKLPAKRVWLAWLLDIITAIFGRKDK